jgi:hypothetical protein
MRGRYHTDRLTAAVNAEPPLLARSPAARATPPTAKEARSPEIHPWTAERLAAFLSSQYHEP